MGNGGLRAPRRRLVLLGLLVVAFVTPVARAGSGAAEVTAALALLDAGREAEAEASLLALVTAYPQRAGLQFWLARAARAAGHLDVASSAIAQSLHLDASSVDAWYLSGLIASDSGDRALALASFSEVTGRDPSSPLAANAQERVRSLRWFDDRDAAVARLRAGDVAGAVAALDGLSQRRPGDLVVQYHRAYADHLRGDEASALAGFDAALADHPGDGWTQYMRAVALARLDREDEARQAFSALAQSVPGEVASEAAAALVRLDAPTPDAGSVGEGDVSWRARVGSVVDGNPLYVSEKDLGGSGDLGVGVSVSGSASGVVWRGDRARLVLGGRGVARGYATGPSGADFAQVSVSAEETLTLDRSEVWAGVDAAVSLLAWQPLSDLEQVYVGGRRHVNGRLHLDVTGGAFRRQAHLTGYDNLDAVGVSGQATATWRPTSAARVVVGWRVRGEDASPYTLGWTTTEGVVTVLEADAGFVGHGPLASVRVGSPWRHASVGVSGQWEWRRYGAPETQSLDGQAATERLRRDTRLVAGVTAGLDITDQLRLVANVSSVRNGSTLDGGSWPIDREFHRLWGGVGVEVHR